VEQVEVGRGWGRGPRPRGDPTRSKAARSLRAPGGIRRSPAATWSRPRGSAAAGTLVGGTGEAARSRTSAGFVGLVVGPRLGGKDCHGGGGLEQLFLFLII